MRWLSALDAVESRAELTPPEVHPGGDLIGSGTRTRERIRVALTALGGYTALAALVFSSAWAAPARLAPGAGNDQAQTAWWLAWFPYAVGHLQNPLLTDHIDVPDGVNLMWNTSIPLPAALLSPVTVLLGPLVAYCVLITAAPALSAWTGFLALRRLVPGLAGPAAGGALFGFSPFVLAQSLAHAQVTLLLAAPLELMALHSLLVRGSPPWRSGVRLGLAAAVQLLISEEVLVIEVVVATVSLGAIALLHPAAARSRIAVLGRGLCAATATLALIAALPLAVQFLGPQHPHGVPEPPSVFVTDAAALVLPTGVQALAPDAALQQYQDHIGRNNAEQDGYLGLPLIALCTVAAVAWRRRPLIRWAALSGLAVTLLALGPTLRVDGRAVGWVPVPWNALGRLPVLDQVLPTRFMGLAFLFAAVIVAVVVAALTTDLPARRRVMWGAGLAAVAVSLLPALPYPAREWRVPAFFTGGAASVIPTGSVVLVSPFPQGSAPQAMLWQAEAGMRFRMVGGYAYRPDPQGRFTLASPPSTTMRLMQAVDDGGGGPTPTERASMLGELRAWGVGGIVVGPSARRSAVVGMVTGLVGRGPDSDDGEVALWSSTGGALVPAAGT